MAYGEVFWLLIGGMVMALVTIVLFFKQVDKMVGGFEVRRISFALAALTALAFTFVLSMGMYYWAPPND